MENGSFLMLSNRFCPRALVRERERKKDRFLTKLVHNPPRATWLLTLFPQGQVGEWSRERALSAGGVQQPSAYTSQDLMGDHQLFSASCVKKETQFGKPQTQKHVPISRETAVTKPSMSRVPQWVILRHWGKDMAQQRLQSYLGPGLVVPNTLLRTCMQRLTRTST